MELWHHMVQWLDCARGSLGRRNIIVWGGIRWFQDSYMCVEAEWVPSIAGKKCWDVTLCHFSDVIKICTHFGMITIKSIQHMAHKHINNMAVLISLSWFSICETILDIVSPRISPCSNVAWRMWLLEVHTHVTELWFLPIVPMFHCKVRLLFYFHYYVIMSAQNLQSNQ